MKATREQSYSPATTLDMTFQARDSGGGRHRPKSQAVVWISVHSPTSRNIARARHVTSCAAQTPPSESQRQMSGTPRLAWVDGATAPVDRLGARCRGFSGANRSTRIDLTGYKLPCDSDDTLARLLHPPSWDQEEAVRPEIGSANRARVRHQVQVGLSEFSC